MNTKIKIKIGPIEIECEGEEAFIKTELPGLIDKISNIKGLPATTGLGGFKPTSANPLAVSVIAQKLGETDGSGVLFAACCFLTASGKDAFSRDEIIAAAKSATTYYKSSVLKNMSSYLKTLCKAGKLNDLGGGRYSLADKGIAALQSLK
jgi:hypothetical protein